HGVAHDPPRHLAERPRARTPPRAHPRSGEARAGPSVRSDTAPSPRCADFSARRCGAWRRRAPRSPRQAPPHRPGRRERAEAPHGATLERGAAARPGARRRRERPVQHTKRAVLWDSSAILALLDADDADHDAASEIAHRIAAQRRPSFITNYIEAEAHALLLRKLGRALAREWLLAGGLPVGRAPVSEEGRAKL